MLVASVTSTICLNQFGGRGTIPHHFLKSCRGGSHWDTQRRLIGRYAMRPAIIRTIQTRLFDILIVRLGFTSEVGPKRTSSDIRSSVAIGGKADVTRNAQVSV